MIKLRQLRLFVDLIDRERRYLVTEMPQVKGLMPLLMKRRNDPASNRPADYLAEGAAVS